MYLKAENRKLTFRKNQTSGSLGGVEECDVAEIVSRQMKSYFLSMKSELINEIMEQKFSAVEPEKIRNSHSEYAQLRDSLENIKIEMKSERSQKIDISHIERLAKRVDLINTQLKETVVHAKTS
jgi:hypothetical protein